VIGFKGASGVLRCLASACVAEVQVLMPMGVLWWESTGGGQVLDVLGSGQAFWLGVPRGAMPGE